MARRLRYVPPGGSLVEVGLRCQEARYYLRPSKRLNSLTIGVLGRAQRRTDMKVVAAGSQSNHVHWGLFPENAEQLSEFLHYSNGNLAREVGRLHDKQDGIWAGRAAVMLVSDEEAAQVARLRYWLSQGCKEGLVMSPLDWPGLHAASQILSEEPIQGIWVNRTAYWEARQKLGDKARIEDFEEVETLELSRLPCWEDLSWQEYRERVREMVVEIEKETQEHHRAEGTQPLGRQAILKMNPHHKPKRAKRSPALLVHAATKKAREAVRAAYREFVTSFLAARDKLRKDRPTHGFPEGCFPSPLPFVPSPPILKPG